MRTPAPPSSAPRRQPSRVRSRGSSAPGRVRPQPAAEPSGAFVTAEFAPDSSTDEQAVLRAVVDALTHPGRLLELPVAPVPPATIGPAAAALCLTLCDSRTPLWLDKGASAAAGYFQRHVQCPIVESPADARYALIVDPLDMPDLAEFNQGSSDRPDRATALIVEVERLRVDARLSIVMPGAPTVEHVAMDGLPDGFWSRWEASRSQFPMGVDVLFTCGRVLCGLPRLARVETTGG